MSIGLLHHRPTALVLNESVGGKVAVSTAGAELKVGTDVFPRRHSLHIINDSSSLIYISTKPDFDAVTEGLVIFSGEVLAIDVSPNRPGGPKRFYAKTEEGSTTVRVIEVS